MNFFKTNIILVCLTCSAMLFSGCRTVRAPGNPSESWIAPGWEEKELAKDPVWEAIRQRKIDPGKELGLLDLLDIALSNNPVTREAWQNARAYDARMIKSESTYYPQVTAQTGGAYNKREVDRTTDIVNRADYTIGADATMLVFDFGGRSAGVQKARQLLLVANYDFNQTIQDIVRDTETAYYSYDSSIAAREAAEDDVADAQEILVNAQQKYQVGLVSKLDVLQAESTYNDSLFSLEGAKGDVETSRADLAEIIGVSADTKFSVLIHLEKVPEEIKKDDVSRYIEEALKKRPDIASARSNLKAKEAEVDIATSNILPTLNIGGSMATNWFSYYGSRKGTLTSYKNDYLYSGQFSVDWNVFDGLNNYFTRIEAQREAALERESLVETEISASADVWTKYFNLRTAQKKYVFSEAFLASANASHELATEGYKAGLKSMLDLLQSQSQLSEARSKLIGSRKDFFVAVAELEHAMGALTVEGK
ncbi:MAG: TolC family protein [Candidatus Omnitrophica bacterium]|nr:TolC family protein [Candidatus Omnitrophota bacterium]